MISVLDIKNAATPLFGEPFPYKETRKISSARLASLNDLIPDLDWYFSYIAGWSTSPSRLLALSSLEKREAIDRLSKSFLECFPEQLMNLAHIDEERSPQLYMQLKCAEQVRIMLVDFINQVELTKAQAT